MNEQSHDNGGFKAVAIVTAVIGGIALAVAGTTAAFGAVNAVTRTDQSTSVDASGVTELSANVSAGHVTVRFADVDEAELTVEGSDGRWTLQRDGEELKLRSRDGWWDWQWGDWFGNGARDQRVELTLPEELLGLDADLSLDAGSLDVEGDFGELDVEVAAGGLWLAGSARSVDADVSAGRAEIEIADADEASFAVSAGALVAELTGSAPREVEVEVSAGALDLTLPDVAYNVVENVGAGSFDNGLQTASNARNAVTVELSAGRVALSAGD